MIFTTVFLLGLLAMSAVGYWDLNRRWNSLFIKRKGADYGSLYSKLYYDFLRDKDWEIRRLKEQLDSSPDKRIQDLLTQLKELEKNYASVSWDNNTLNRKVETLEIQLIEHKNAKLFYDMWSKGKGE